MTGWKITTRPDASRPDFLILTAVSGARVIHQHRMTADLAATFDADAEWARTMAAFRAKNARPAVLTAPVEA